jgi:hypothetical protein
MALYTEKSYNDISAAWDDMQRRELERLQKQAVDSYNASQAKAYTAQQKAASPLESVLGGIGNTIGNVGKALGATFGGAGTNNIVTVGLDSLINGKSFSQAARDAKKRQDDLVKGIYGTDNTKDAYTKNLGTSMDAAATLTDFIPGLGTAAKVGLNVGQGVVSGIANPLIEKGSQATLEDAMKGALVGGASAGVGQYVGGKLAGRTAGKGLVSRALNSNIGKAALTGAASGATGAGLNTALMGGNLGQVAGSALQGAQGGALGGATLAGTMGLLGTGIDRLNKRVNPQTGVDTPTTTKIAQNIADDVPEAPRTRVTAPDAEPVSTRRKIDVQYVDDNDGAVNVGRNRSQYRLDDNAGSTLDGILGPNNKRKLPNATVDQKSQFNRLFDSDTNNISDVIRSGALDLEGDDALAKQGILREMLGDEVFNKLREGAREYADIQNSGFEGTLADNKSQLPKLNRQQYYEDTIGKLGKNGNAGLRAADVPDYMQDHLSNDAGRNSLGGTSADNASILRELFGQEGDLADMYRRYEDLAQAHNRNVVYTNDNALGALGMDPELNAAVTEKFLADNYPTRRIDVDKRLPLQYEVDVDSPAGRLIQDVRPAQRRQAQPQVQAQATQETPAQRVRRAADTSNIKVDPSLAPADVARLERQLTVNRQKQGAALLDQYGTLDKPVRRAVGSPEDVLATLYDDYGLRTPADVQYAANHVTGKDGVVSKMTRELAAGADNVDTTITRDWLQELMDSNGLLDDEQKVVTKQITGALKRANVNSDGATTLDIMKQLEKQSARYKGKDGTYHNATESDVRKGVILDLVHDELQDRLWDAAGDPKKVLTPERITELKNMYKGNDTWADFIDNRLAKSTSGAELRSHMKPLVDGSKIVYGSKMSAGSFANNARRMAVGGHPLKAGGQMLYDLAVGSEKAKQAAADKYAREAAKNRAQLTGQAPVSNSGGILNGAKNIASKLANKVSGVTDMLNNDTLSSARYAGVLPSFGEVATSQLARQAGLSQMRNQDAQRELQEAQQEMQNIQNDYNNSAMQLQQSYAQPQAATTAPTSSLNRISQAMDMALAAGDVTAYGQLADLYKQAYNIYSLQNPAATTTQKDLTANQSKALTGLQQLQTLSQMQPGIRTALAGSPLSGLVDITGGDDYSNQAKSLALTLGYLQSGANITPREAENIGKSYIPTAYDSENVRQQKLSRAEQLLRNYLADTSSLATQ